MRTTEEPFATRRETGGERFSFSVVQGNVPKKLPHFPERWVRLGQFRMLQVDLNAVVRDCPTSDLGDRVPTFVLLPPAISIRKPEIAIGNGFSADRGFWTQCDGGHVFLIPWAMRMNFLDREISFPPTQMHHAIVRYTEPHVLEFRKEGEDIP